MSFNEVIETMSNDNKNNVQVVEASASKNVVKAEAGTEVEVKAKAGTETVVETEEAFDALAITKLCDESDAAHMVGHFIKESATEEQVTATLGKLTDLRDKLTAAEMSPAQIASVEKHFNSPADLATAVLEVSASKEPEVVSAISPSGEATKEKSETVDFYDFQES